MYCVNCNKSLHKCDCPDLQERIDALKKCQFIYLTPDQWRVLEEKARQNKEEKTEQE